MIKISLSHSLHLQWHGPSHIRTKLKTHKLLDLLTESWFVIPSVANSNTPSKTQKLWTGFPSLALGHKKSRGKGLQLLWYRFKIWKMSHFNLYPVLKQISSHCFANKKTFHDTVWGVNYNSLQLSGTFLTKYEVAIIVNNTAKFLLVDVLMLKFPI